MNVAMILDVVVLIGLVATIFYAVRLSRQFEVLQKDKGQLDLLIQNLSNATNRADIAVKNMRDTAIDTGENLQSKINTSRALFDELEIMIEAGDNLADRLQNLAEKGRKASTKPSKNKAAASKKTGDENHSRAEKELLAALKANQKK